MIVSGAGQPALAQITLFEDDEARASLNELSERVTLLEGSLRQLAAASARLTSEKQELLGLVRELAGLVEEANVVSSRHSARIDELNTEFRSELQQVDAEISTKIDKLASSITSADVTLYDRGIRAYHRADPANASKHMQRLLQRYPDSRYAPAARYWRGRIGFEQNNLAAARSELVELLASHPASARIPDALALLEQIASEQGSADEARHWQRQLLERHPASAAADERRKRATQTN